MADKLNKRTSNTQLAFNAASNLVIFSNRAQLLLVFCALAAQLPKIRHYRFLPPALVTGSRYRGY